MKVKCKYCRGAIKNQTIDRVICGKKKCKKAYQIDYQRKYREKPGSKERLREYNKEYIKRPYAKKKNQDLNRINHAALRKLKQNHKKEFGRIIKKLKKDYNNKNGK